MEQTKFYRPKAIRTYTWLVFDYKGDWIDIKERGLDENCEVWWKHQRLLIPQQEGQKEYCMCLKCTEYSHL